MLTPHLASKIKFTKNIKERLHVFQVNTFINKTMINWKTQIITLVWAYYKRITIHPRQAHENNSTDAQQTNKKPHSSQTLDKRTCLMAVMKSSNRWWTQTVLAILNELTFYSILGKHKVIDHSTEWFMNLNHSGSAELCIKNIWRRPTVGDWWQYHWIANVNQ